MKKTSILIAIILINLSMQGQFVIINDTIHGGNIIPFQDTILNNYPCDWNDFTTYYIDLDQDTINDIKFEVYCEYDGVFFLDYIKVSTLSDFSFHIDTNYIDSSYYDFGDSIILIDVFKRTVVKKYNSGDTIYENSLSTSEETFLSMFSYTYTGWPDQINGNVCHFLGDTSYIAFIKNNGQSEYIYYFKVFVQDYSIIQLISAKSNDIIYSGNAETRIQNGAIYPNPVEEKIFFLGDFSFYEIYTLQGISIQSGWIIDTQNSIIVSDIPHGLYILKLRNKEIEYNAKFIKN